jgi:hypothetical protein
VRDAKNQDQPIEIPRFRYRITGNNRQDNKQVARESVMVSVIGGVRSGKRPSTARPPGNVLFSFFKTS